MKSIQAFFLSTGLLMASVAAAQANIVTNVEDFEEKLAAEKRGNMIVYADTNFGGVRTVIRESSPNIISTGLNDTIESMQITNGRWKFCTEIDYQGSCIILTPGNYPNLNIYNLSNNISSVEFQ